MKKLTKFFVAALALALLLGTVIGISASAAGGSEDPWIISKNVSYSENIHLMLAVDANKVEDESKLAVRITVNGVTTEDYFSMEYKADLFGSSDEGAIPVYIIRTLGVAAKDMADALAIDVVYDGVVVESINYSVAEYFFQKLYADEEALATDGAALNRKNLYLSSLKYGNAAQKLLSASDDLYIENMIYVISSVEGVGGILDSRELLSLDAGYYSVKSYVDGKAVDSVVNGGKYSIKNSARITEVFAEPPKYEIPEGALTFEDKEVDTTIAEDESLADDISYAFDSEKDSVLINVKEQTPARSNLVTRVAEENGNKYLHYSKTKIVEANSAMTWLIAQRTASVESDKTVVFETRIRFALENDSGSNYIRVYNGRTAATATGGTNLYGSDISFKASGVGSGKTVMINGVNSPAISGEWFTLRLVMKGETIDFYVSNSENLLEYVTSVSKSGVDFSTCDGVQFTTSVEARHTLDLDNVYFGADIPMPSYGAAPELSSPANQINEIATNETQSGWKGTNSVYKDILTGKAIVIVDDLYNKSGDVVDSGQSIIRFNYGTATSDTIKVSAALRFDSASNGFFDASTSDRAPCLRLQTKVSGSYKDIMYVYFFVVNGQVKLKCGAEQVTIAKFGEWFNVEYTYTYTPASGETSESATASIKITLENGTTQTYTCTPTNKYDPTETRVSLVPTTNFIGQFTVEGLAIWEGN